MKLKKIRVKNFRGYDREVVVSIGDMTAFVGKNDAGKSTIPEVLDVFFSDGGGRHQDGQFNISCDDRRGCASMRSAIWTRFADSPELREGPVKVAKNGGQGSTGVHSVWNDLTRVLPVYSLFRSDRKNSDEDAEVQNPPGEAVKAILPSPQKWSNG